jgi:long-chain acyl-CoA synthetase
MERKIVWRSSTMIAGDVIRRNARRYPGKVALITEDFEFSYKELNERINQLCHALQEKGLKFNSKIAILANNLHHYVEVFFAAAKCGMVSVPINWRFSKREWSLLLSRSDVEMLIVEDQFTDDVDEIRPELPMLEQYIIIGDDKDGWLNYEHLYTHCSKNEPSTAVHPEDEVFLWHTSGTTGPPKEVIWTHENWLAGVRDVIISHEVNSDCVFLSAIPAFHIGFGWLLCTYMYTGATFVMLDRFDAGEFLQTIEGRRITDTLLLPTMINMLCEHPDIENYDYRSLRLFIYGGSPMNLKLLEKATTIFGPVFHQDYGFSEQAGAVTFLPRKDHIIDGTEKQRKRLLSCGKEMISNDVRVLNDQGEEVNAGEIGEIVVRGDNLMKGYWKSPEETAKYLKDGWYYTGDMATIDEDHYIYIVDRRKDVIISGGENISSREVEEIISTHHGVSECVVIGVPDDKWGEAVKALIYPKPGMKLMEEELIEHCKERLARYKAPKSIDFWNEPFPKTPIGKIKKAELREKYWLGQERKIH